MKMHDTKYKMHANFSFYHLKYKIHDANVLLKWQIENTLIFFLKILHKVIGFSKVISRQNAVQGATISSVLNIRIIKIDKKIKIAKS